MTIRLAFTQQRSSDVAHNHPKQATPKGRIMPKHNPKKHHHHDNDDDDSRSYFATRLCIRNLPAKKEDVTEDRIRQWLLQVIPTNKPPPISQLLEEEGTTSANHAEPPLQITDCRVLRKGRQSMAFVGVASAEQADLLIQQFDRTYYRTSRVAVERAYKSLKLQQPPKAGSTAADAGGSSQDHQDAVDSKGTIEVDAKRALTKTKAFAAAAGKKKFWANEATADQHVGLHHGADKVESDDDSSTSGSSEEDRGAGDDDNDDDNPLLQNKTTKTDNAQSDVDFLKSIQTSAEDLEQDETSGSSDTESSDSASDEVVDMKQPAMVDDQQEESHLAELFLSNVPEHIPTSRIFVRNLPFSTTEEDLKVHFESSGGESVTVLDCHIPVTDQKRPKGFAFVTLSNPKEVMAVIANLDGCDFQGRILHLLPAHPKQDEVEEGAGAVRSYKDQKELERRLQTNLQTNKAGLSSFVRSDAVVDTLASRMGFHKGDILSVKDGLSSGDAAVRLALGETAVIEENRKFLEERGIALGADESASKRSNTCILVKNLPADTSKEDLMKVFGAIAASTEGSTFGPSRFDLAPSRTLALVEYSHRNDAKTAMRRLAYRRFKSVPLYLEWAPMIRENRDQGDDAQNDLTEVPQEVDDDNDDLVTGPSPTVHVKNLNFATTEERLRNFFLEYAKDVRAVRIPQKVVPVKRLGREAEGVRSLSMGYGFVEFGSHDSCRLVMKSLQGALLDGHALEIAPSTKNQTGTVPAAVAGRPKPPNKLVVRNVPFQATRKDLLSLFGSFGQLKKLRLPKKFDGAHRGFAFVEYLTNKEADAAYRALSSTHLYGRHLVIEWATEDDEDIVKLREKTKRTYEGSGAPKSKKARVPN